MCKCCMLCWLMCVCILLDWEEILINISLQVCESVDITWQLNWNMNLKHLSMMSVTCREPGYSSQSVLPPQRRADGCSWLYPAAESRPQTDSVGWLDSLWRPWHADPPGDSLPAHPGSGAQRVDPVEENKLLLVISILKHQLSVSTLIWPHTFTWTQTFLSDFRATLWRIFTWL